MSNYKIIKVLNNNVILAESEEQSEEVILLGKGIGFGKKSGRFINTRNDKVEKIFCNFGDKVKEDYIELINDIDYKLISVGEEIIARAQKKLGPLNPHVHIALTDHIGFALERLKKGMVINNPFLFEIKALYKEEFDVGLQAKNIINEKLKVTIPDSEVGFIAMHLHSSKQNQDIKHTMHDTRLLKNLLDVIEQELGGKVDKNLIMYSRLINHLKQSISRVEQSKEIINPLLGDIKIKLKDSFEIGQKISQIIKQEKGKQVSDDEIGFLALHIERLKESIY